MPPAPSREAAACRNVVVTRRVRQGDPTSSSPLPPAANSTGSPGALSAASRAQSEAVPPPFGRKGTSRCASWAARASPAAATASILPPY
eukprot:scaffold4605_cov105-Isochrysis_galbana.AAC.1